MRIILIAILFISNNAINYGQKQSNTNNFTQNHRVFVNKLLELNSGSIEANRMENKAMVERVIGQSTKDHLLNSIVDSSQLDYVFNGTSVFDFNQMVYQYNYPYSTSPMFNFLGIATQPTILYHNYLRWTINPNTLVYGFYQNEDANYDVNNNLINDTTLYVDSTVNLNKIFSNAFNISNQVLSSYQNIWKSGNNDSLYKQFFYYNGSGKLQQDSTYILHLGIWRLANKSKYYYDGSNNLIKIDNYANVSDTSYLLPLIKQLQYVNTYDGSNRLLTVQTSYYDGAALNPYVKDTFSYTGAITFHTGWKEYQYDVINGYWAPMTYMHKHLNIINYPDTVYTDTYDSLLNMWTPYYRDIYTYDGYNNPITCRNYIYNWIAWPATPDFTTKYYYEIFDNTTLDQESVNFNAPLVVYPNPTHDQINLVGYSIKAKIFITDVFGKIVLTENINDNIINIQNLSSGIYFLCDEYGNKVKFIKE